MTVPPEAPLRQANGCHWGRFEPTIVEVETDEGITELGEMDGIDGRLIAKVAAELHIRHQGKHVHGARHITGSKMKPGESARPKLAHSPFLVY